MVSRHTFRQEAAEAFSLAPSVLSHPHTAAAGTPCHPASTRCSSESVLSLCSMIEDGFVPPTTDAVPLTCLALCHAFRPHRLRHLPRALAAGLHCVVEGQGAGHAVQRSQPTHLGGGAWPHFCAARAVFTMVGEVAPCACFLSLCKVSVRPRPSRKTKIFGAHLLNLFRREL